MFQRAEAVVFISARRLFWKHHNVWCREDWVVGPCKTNIKSKEHRLDRTSGQQTLTRSLFRTRMPLLEGTVWTELCQQPHQFIAVSSDRWWWGGLSWPPHPVLCPGRLDGTAEHCACNAADQLHDLRQVPRLPQVSVSRLWAVMTLNLWLVSVFCLKPSNDGLLL